MSDLLVRLRDLLGGGSPQSAEAVDLLLHAERERDPLLPVALDYCRAQARVQELLAEARALEARLCADLEAGVANVQDLLAAVLKWRLPLHRRHLIGLLAAGWYPHWTEVANGPDWLCHHAPATYSPLDAPVLTALCAAVGVVRSENGAVYGVMAGHAFVPRRTHTHWVQIGGEVTLPAPTVEHIRSGVMARWDAEARCWTCSDPGMPPQLSLLGGIA